MHIYFRNHWSRLLPDVIRPVYLNTACNSSKRKPTPPTPLPGFLAKTNASAVLKMNGATTKGSAPRRADRQWLTSHRWPVKLQLSRIKYEMATVSRICCMLCNSWEPLWHEGLWYQDGIRIKLRFNGRVSLQLEGVCFGVCSDITQPGSRVLIREQGDIHTQLYMVNRDAVLICINSLFANPISLSMRDTYRWE